MSLCVFKKMFFNKYKDLISCFAMEMSKLSSYFFFIYSSTTFLKHKIIFFQFTNSYINCVNRFFSIFCRTQIIRLLFLMHLNDFFLHAFTEKVFWYFKKNISSINITICVPVLPSQVLNFPHIFYLYIFRQRSLSTKYN